MNSIGLMLAATVLTLAVSVTVFVSSAPPPSAQEIATEVVTQLIEHEESERKTKEQSVTARRNAARCGLPDYGACQ